MRRTAACRLLLSLAPLRRGPRCALALLLTACAQDYDVTEARRELGVPPLVDAGGATVNRWETLGVPLYSLSRGVVNVRQITIQNEGDSSFVLLPSWPNTDADRDGQDDALVFEPGNPDLSVLEELEVSFRPGVEGYFRAQVWLDSNDNTVEDVEAVEGVHDGEGVHRFNLRGLARWPQITWYPQVLDYGRRAVGGYFYDTITVENDSPVTLIVSGFQLSGSSSFFVATTAPVYILPGDAELIEVGFIPGSTSATSATLTLVTSDPDASPSVTLIGNDCTQSSDATWDRDGDGWMDCGGDCDDANHLIYPDAEESDNGKDDDCDGKIDEAPDSLTNDNDGDGLSEADGDCWDDDELVGPSAPEVADNLIDDDCDGSVDEGGARTDDDGDGFAEREGDCDDADPATGPGARELADGLDGDCDGRVDEGTAVVDDDQDGLSEDEGDCADWDAWTWPGAQEDCDRIDNDCDGLVDEASGADSGDGTGEGEGACAYVAAEAPAVPPQTGTCSTGRRELGWTGIGAVGLALLARWRRKERA